VSWARRADGISAGRRRRPHRSSSSAWRARDTTTNSGVDDVYENGWRRFPQSLKCSKLNAPEFWYGYCPLKPALDPLCCNSKGKTRGRFAPTPRREAARQRRTT